jgi:hypothetical protein
VLPDNGGEVPNRQFCSTAERLGARHSLIHAGGQGDRRALMAVVAYVSPNGAGAASAGLLSLKQSVTSVRILSPCPR